VTPLGRRSIALGLVLGAAGLGAGLWLGLSGGSGGPSQDEYLAHVSSVCRTYARRLQRVPAPSDPAAYGDVASAVRRVVPLLRAQAAAMQAVEAPAALRHRLDRLFALDRRSVAELETALAAALRRDAGGVARGFIRFASIRDRVHETALALGIHCDAN
jgi:hypothetical protein